MKLFPFALTLLISLGSAISVAAEAPKEAPKGTPATPNGITVLAISADAKKPPTAKSINSGQTLILVGTAVSIPAGTKLTCCVDQLGKVRVPLKSFNDLEAYDITKEGTIDQNEAGYKGLFIAKVLPNGNLITSTLKEAGMIAVHFTPDKKSAAVEYNTKKTVPLVLVAVPE